MFVLKRTILICIGLIALSTGCRPSRDDVWDVIAIGLPPEISPELVHSNSVSYLFRQTHEPILRIGDNNLLYSNILSRWSRSEDYRRFSFCPKGHIEFNEGEVFKPAHLLQALVKLKSLFPSLSGSIENDCVVIQLNKAARTLPDKLTDLQFAPNYRDSRSGFHYGLGPYKIAEQSEKAIVLRRKVPSKDGFNTIRMISYTSLSDRTEDVRDIEDFNLIPVEKIPAWVTKEFSNFPVSLLRVFGIIINIQNSTIRETLFNCIDIPEFRDIFFGRSQPSIDIASVFPIGIEGALPGQVHQDCVARTSNRKVAPVIFANWKPDLENDLQTYFDKFSSKSSIPVKVKNYDPTELSTLLFKDRTGYDMMVVALDTNNEEYLPFFEPFLDQEKRIHSVKLPHLANQYKKMKVVEARHELIKLARQINAGLMGQAIFIPLLQQTRMYGLRAETWSRKG